MLPVGRRLSRRPDLDTATSGQSRSAAEVGLSQEMRVAAPGALTAAPVKPLYLQVYHAITDAVRAGSLKPGDRLPPDQQPRSTVRR